MSDLMRELRLDKAVCAVEVNKRLIPKPAQPLHLLGEGDEIEVVTLVGGG